jgi:hypothetical protein
MVTLGDRASLAKAEPLATQDAELVKGKLTMARSNNRNRSVDHGDRTAIF